ncbi:hypothetical protein Fmac_027127 [Flemingia macrophylla]|uniref:Uncharacterized protein n=1 Tax=Flemingia macrophylla TaxID=520843 RepID=A0ABD1LH18_9FABA
MEAAWGILENLALSRVNHNIMVEAGVIPKLAKLLTSNLEGSKVIRKEARNVLLELVKDNYYRILVIEEGLVPVPLVGAAAFKSFTPGLHLWPTLPDGTEIERTSRQPSRYGASELLLRLNIDEKNANLEEAKVNAIVGRTQQQFLARVVSELLLRLNIDEKNANLEEAKVNAIVGRTQQQFLARVVSELLLRLNIDEKNANLEEAKVNAIVGRTQQQFLARVGALEIEEKTRPHSECSNGQKFTLLPWMDGVARLVLILELEDKPANIKAAESIATAFQLAATTALERLSVSNNVCWIIEAEGVLGPLSLSILARILDPSKEMQLKFYDGSADGSEKAFGGAKSDGVSTRCSSTEQVVSKTYKRKDILDSVLIAQLVEILKSSPPSLQEKAASVLEFVALNDTTLAPITVFDIESGLNSVFQQKILKISVQILSDLEPIFPFQFTLSLFPALSRDCSDFHLVAVNSLSQCPVISRGVLRGLMVLPRVPLICASVRPSARQNAEVYHNAKFKDSADMESDIEDQFLKHMQLNLKKLVVTDKATPLSSIPLHSKDWVAACLVKLSSLSGSIVSLYPINMEVTLYETILPFPPETQETAVVELNRIISEGVVDSTEAIVSDEAIYSLVNLIEEGSDRAGEESLAILYNLSMDSENHSALVAAGAVQVLKRIVLSNRPHWERALLLLRILQP